MEESDYIWLNGKLVDWNDANTHILSHSLHYGLSVFEGLRFYETKKGPAIFRLNDHTIRLLDGIKNALMEFIYTKNEINSAIETLVKKNQLKSGYIRPHAYYGYGKMGLYPKGASVNLSISCWPWGSYLGEAPIKVKISKYKRIHPDTTNIHCKFGGHYVNSILAANDARSSGFDESILLDHNGNIAEGPAENFFIVKDKTLFTPKTDFIIKGITRDTILQIANDLGINTKETDLSPKDVYNANEAFFSGTAAEITSIKSIDNTRISNAPGEITSKIKQTYLDIVHGKIEKYNHWLTYIKK